MKLAGRRRDGSAFSLDVTSRTSRVRLYKEGDVAALDVGGIESAAPKLAIFESGSDGPIRVSHLEALAKLPALTNLSLSVDSECDVTVLARAPALRHLSLTLWDRGEFDCAWLRDSPVESLSLSFKGQKPKVDVASLTKLESLSLSGITNRELSLPPTLENFYVDDSDALEALGGATLAGLRTFNVMHCKGLRSVDTAPFADGPLEVFSLSFVNELAELDFVPLGRAKSLRSFTLINHAIRFLDLTPLAKLRARVGFQIDGKDQPFVAQGDIASPALRRWAAEGALTREP